MSRAIELAESITSILNTVEFSRSFTAIRSYRATFTIKELSTLHVVVVPSAIVQTPLGRGSNLDDITIDIVVLKQIDPTNNEELDSMMDLVQEIADHFRGSRSSLWQWVSTNILIPYDPEDLTDRRVFTSLIQLRYHLMWVKNVSTTS